MSKRQDRHGLGADMDGLTKHVMGAAGEIAVAKAMGLFWGGDVCTFKAPDIGNHIQVRTRSRHDWDLIVRPEDDDDAVFVLVTGSIADLHVRGWISGREAKKDRWLQQYGGRPCAYFVPQSALRGMHEASRQQAPSVDTDPWLSDL